VLGKQISLRPNATAAGVGGAVGVLVVYVGGLAGWNPPPEVAAAVATLASAFSVEARQVRNGNGNPAASESGS
jgi:hypothetical protein